MCFQLYLFLANRQLEETTTILKKNQHNHPPEHTSQTQFPQKQPGFIPLEVVGVSPLKAFIV